MSKPYPREFRDDVVRVARNRDPDVRIKDIAADVTWHRDSVKEITYGEDCYAGSVSNAAYFHNA